jgi:NTE family protein
MRAAKRLKIGLALGEGAARGLAHIGVIQELERLGIEIGWIAGTSIGAVVGGWYAATRDSARLEEVARHLNMRELFGVRAFSPRRTGAFLDTRRVAAWMRKELGDPAIEDLSLPFAAVATDITAGRRVVLAKGNLVDAMLISSAVPIVFPPTRRGSSVLIDGGIIEPVPFRTCHELGARRVLGVDLSANVVQTLGKYVGARGFWKPWQLFNIIYNVYAVMSHELTMTHMHRTDWLITPDVGNIFPTNFASVDAAIEAGRRAVRAWHDNHLVRLPPRHAAHRR